MAYASASNVAGFCQNLLGNVDNFSTSTCPTLTEVNAWLSSGCGVIEAHLSANSYSVPVASTAGVYSWLNDLNSLFAAARAEMSRSNVTLAPGERTRGQVFDEMFWKQLGFLLSLDLTNLGVNRSSGGTIYTGGISITTKDSYDSDTDRVPPRFRRAQFAFPGTDRPSDLAAS